MAGDHWSVQAGDNTQKRSEREAAERARLKADIARGVAEGIKKAVLRGAVPAILVTMVAACTTPEPIPIDRQPSADLLQPCERPAIPPAKPTSNETAAGWVNATRIALDCGALHASLVYFVQNKDKTAAPKTVVATDPPPKKGWWPW